MKQPQSIRKVDYMTPRDVSRGKPRSYPWKFKITRDYCHQSSLRGYQCDSDWLRVEPCEKITVKAGKHGYAWDGCTPKFSQLGLVILGTPDGHIDIETMKPKTYYASLAHDALYQYLEDIPIPRDEIDRVFLEMLRETAFPLARMYYIAVRIFGGIGVVQHGVNRK